MFLKPTLWIFIINESVFQPLREEKPIPEKHREITYNTSTMSHFDSRINQCKLEVQRTIHLENLVNQLLDTFTDTNKNITKSHIPTANTSA